MSAAAHTGNLAGPDSGVMRRTWPIQLGLSGGLAVGLVLCLGISLAVLPQAQATPAAAQDADLLNPSWDHYHSTEEAYALLRAWAAAYPELTELYSIGETLEGTPLLVLEITNKASGPALEKPGYYYDGNIHSGELTGAEVALHFAWYLLSQYGEDARVTRLVDNRTLYVRPKFNPDGADIALTTPQNLRSTPRPYDEDGDGLLDEDPTNDLDGDGQITQMRFADPEGRWMISLDDPRIMVRRPPAGESGAAPDEATRASGATAASGEALTYYNVVSEGIDDDGDGRLNEDGIGGIDMNRNFPRNWGMEFEQSGAGPFPLSEPETRATLDFIEAHRNITGIFHGHTSGGFAFRLPSTTSWENFPAADQELILEQSAKFEETTKQPARPSYTNPAQHRHGTLISWGYWDFGVVGFVPEFWGGIGEDEDGDGEISQTERLRFNDERLEGRYFTDWATYEHPELGALEIGGWHRKLVSQNAPPELLAGELELYVPWMLWLAEIAPEIEIGTVTAQAVESGDAAESPVGMELLVTVEVRNVGYLPTNLTQRALDAHIAVPVRLVIVLQDAELLEGQSRTDLGHLAGSRDGSDAAPRSAEVEYRVRVTGPSPLLSFSAVSERAGTDHGQVGWHE